MFLLLLIILIYHFELFLIKDNYKIFKDFIETFKKFFILAIVIKFTNFEKNALK